MLVSICCGMLMSCVSCSMLMHIADSRLKTEAVVLLHLDHVSIYFFEISSDEALSMRKRLISLFLRLPVEHLHRCLCLILEDRAVDCYDLEDLRGADMSLTAAAAVATAVGDVKSARPSCRVEVMLENTHTFAFHKAYICKSLARTQQYLFHENCFEKTKCCECFKSNAA